MQRVRSQVRREKGVVWKIRPSRVLYHPRSDFVETSAEVSWRPVPGLIRSLARGSAQGSLGFAPGITSRPSQAGRRLRTLGGSGRLARGAALGQQ
jgi:hypothetical protein